MDVSPNALRRETVQLLNGVNQQITQVKAQAAGRGLDPVELRDERSNPVLVPLFHAKALCLNTLAVLRGQ